MIKNGILLFIFAFFVLVVFMPSYRDLQDLKSRNATLQTEILALQQKNVELTQEQKRLEEDPVYLEGVAREKMGIVREGEVVYKILPEESPQ